MSKKLSIIRGVLRAAGSLAGVGLSGWGLVALIDPDYSASLGGPSDLQVNEAVVMVGIGLSLVGYCFLHHSVDEFLGRSAKTLGKHLDELRKKRTR